MNKEELSKAARRFSSVVDGLDFTSLTTKHKGKNHEDKEVDIGKAEYQVKRGAGLILLAETEEEAKEKSNRLNELVQPFILEELEILKSKVN